MQPKREDGEVLERIKREIGIQRFAAQYLQQPVPDGGNAIKREWLQFYDTCPVQQPGDRIGQSWDVAAGIGDASSHDVLLYSAKAAKHKYIYPYLRYGFVVVGLQALERRLSARQCT